jgi:hypothetical protein
MTNIVIKDLKENIELDRKAMQAISGGKSGTFSSAPAHHSSTFSNPFSFNGLRLLPGFPEAGDGHG